MLREKVVEKEIRLEYVSTKEKIANISTKPFPNETFEYLRDIVGVKCPFLHQSGRCKNRLVSFNKAPLFFGLNDDASCMGEYL